MSPDRPDRDVARLQRQQTALAEFGSYAFRETVLANILNEAARVCAEGLGVPFCKNCRYRPEENDLLVDAGFGWHRGVVGLVISEANESSPQGRAYVTGQPVIIANIAQSNELRLPAFYRQHHIVSTIDVVIKSTSDRPYGVLEIDSTEQQVFDQHDVDFLTGFANVLAEAVATAHRSEVLRDTLEQMRQLVIDKDKLLIERATLAQELQHRVRNNLQLVTGMLTSHLRQDFGAEERSSIDAIIRRVTTLSEVYEQLLGGGMGGTIDFGAYLRSLCARLPSMQRPADIRVTLTCDAQAVQLNLDSVTVLGMVVAELVSNSYGHAFGNVPGTIEVVLRHLDRASTAALTVKDNGSGYVEPAETRRHGLGLVRRLAEQVGGTLALATSGGTTWTLTFPLGSAAPLPAPA